MDDTTLPPHAAPAGPPLPAPLHRAAPEDDSDLVEAIRRQLESMLPDAPPPASGGTDLALASALAGLAGEAGDADLPFVGPPAPAGAEGADTASGDADHRTHALLGELNRLWRRGAN